MTKSILYISQYVSLPGTATAGTRGFYLMREIAKKGIRCTIITSDNVYHSINNSSRGSLTNSDTPNLCILRLRTIKYKRSKSFLRILGWLKFELKLYRIPKKMLSRPDVIIVSSLSLFTILNGIRLKKLYGSKLIFEIRDIWPLTLVEEGGYRKSNPFIMLLGLIEKYGYSKADIIVGTMPNLAEHVKHVVKTEKRVECIPFGLDDQTILSSPSDVIQTSLINTYIPRDKFVVCYAGSIGLTNALETLFKCAELMKQDKDVHFIIMGDGDLKIQYQREFGHLKNVSFFPQIEKHMLQSILVACDLLYFATKNSLVWRYGQSLNKIIDYMLAGRPIIGSYSGYPSMINEADCGSFVPAENEVALMKEIVRYKMMPKEERDRIGKRGHDWLLENRKYQYLADKYIDIING